MAKICDRQFSMHTFLSTTLLRDPSTGIETHNSVLGSQLSVLGSRFSVPGSRVFAVSSALEAGREKEEEERR